MLLKPPKWDFRASNRRLNLLEVDPETGGGEGTIMGIAGEVGRVRHQGRGEGGGEGKEGTTTNTSICICTGTSTGTSRGRGMALGL